MPVEREEKVSARERSRHRENVFVRDTEEDYYISMVHVGGN